CVSHHRTSPLSPPCFPQEHHRRHPSEQSESPSASSAADREAPQDTPVPAAPRWQTPAHSSPRRTLYPLSVYRSLPPRKSRDYSLAQTPQRSPPASCANTYASQHRSFVP